jgi:flavin reductase (DIM6/NTAB) family NADH-FMN oxidoreductase RutF
MWSNEGTTESSLRTMSLQPARSLLVYIDDPSACVHSHMREGSNFTVSVVSANADEAANASAAAATSENDEIGRIEHLQ